MRNSLTLLWFRCCFWIASFSDPKCKRFQSLQTRTHSIHRKVKLFNSVNENILSSFESVFKRLTCVTLDQGICKDTQFLGVPSEEKQSDQSIDPSRTFEIFVSFMSPLGPKAVPLLMVTLRTASSTSTETLDSKVKGLLSSCSVTIVFFSYFGKKRTETIFMVWWLMRETVRGH